LELATKNNISTVALPSISSGGNGFPKQAAAQTILRAINAYFKNLSEKKINEAQPNQVYFVLYDPESVSIYTSELSKLDINA
jgi:histone H2A